MDDVYSPTYIPRNTAPAPNIASKEPLDGPVILPALARNVDEALGAETDPVPALPLPAVVPVVELEKPPPLTFSTGPGFVTLNELPAMTLAASPACVKTDMTSKPKRVLAASSRALVD